MKIVKNFSFLLLFIFITLDLSVHAAARPGAAAPFGLRRDGHVPVAALAAAAALRPPPPALAPPAPAAAAQPPAIAAGLPAPIIPASAIGQARRPASPATESGTKRLRVDQTPTPGGALGEVKEEKEGKSSDKDKVESKEKKVVKEGFACVICRDDDDNKDQPRVKKFSCSHTLHKACLDGFLASTPHPRCPLCNTTTTKFTEDLRTAIKRSDEKAVEALLNTAAAPAGVLENIEDAKLIAPELLLLAIIVGNYSIIHALLNAGFDCAKRIDIKNKIFGYGEDQVIPDVLNQLPEMPSACEWASALGLYEIVEKCCDKNKKIVLARDDIDRTLLHHASRGITKRTLDALHIELSKKGIASRWINYDPDIQDSIETIGVLLRHGSDREAQDLQGYTPLHDAVVSSSMEAFIELKRIGADIDTINNRRQTLLHTAALENNVLAIPVLCAGDEKGEHKAAIEGRTKKGNTPLHCAALTGSVEVIVELRRRGANIDAVNNDGETPLHLAAYEDRVLAIKELCEKGERKAAIESTDHKGNTPLHLAAIRGSVKAIAELRRLGANIDAVNNDGHTPLHLAAYNNRALAIQELCEKDERKAAIDSKDPIGRTPLHHAAEAGSVEAIVELRRLGANVNAIGNEGERPLHIAAYYNHAPAIKELCEGDEKGERKANIESKDLFGCTPLHIAAMNGSEEAIIELRRLGANLDAVNNDDQTFLQVAEEHGHIEAISAALASSVASLASSTLPLLSSPPLAAQALPTSSRDSVALLSPSPASVTSEAPSAVLPAPAAVIVAPALPAGPQENVPAPMDPSE